MQHALRGHTVSNLRDPSLFLDKFGPGAAALLIPQGPAIDINSPSLLPARAIPTILPP
jgi:hypothetical protein